MRARRVDTSGATMSQLGRLLTVGKAAAHVGVSVSQLRKAIGRGEVLVMRHTSGRVMGVYTVHVERWQDERLAPPTSRRARPVDIRMQQLIRELGA